MSQTTTTTKVQDIETLPLELRWLRQNAIELGRDKVKKNLYYYCDCGDTDFYAHAEGVRYLYHWVGDTIEVSVVEKPVVA